MAHVFGPITMPVILDIPLLLLSRLEIMVLTH